MKLYDWPPGMHKTGQIIIIIATSAEVTPNGGLVRESPSKCPEIRFMNYSTLPRESHKTM